jgi:hypothetical protein
VRLTPDRLKLTVAPEVVASFQKVHLSLGERSYLLDLPQIAAATERASLDTRRAPAVVKKGAAAIVDFEGAGARPSRRREARAEDPAASGLRGWLAPSHLSRRERDCSLRQIRSHD